MFELFKKKIPHCDELFIKYFSPWYSENERPKMTRPDLYQIDGFNGQPLDLDKLQYLTDESLQRNTKQVKAMADTALNDFQNIYKSDKIDLKFLDAVDKYFDRHKISELIKKSDPSDFSNPYLVTVCQFGAILGQLFSEVEGFGWLYSYPYFHSIIVHKDTGIGITVFDWGVKKFSEYGVDDGFAAKFNAALEGIKQEDQRNTLGLY